MPYAQPDHFDAIEDQTLVVAIDSLLSNDDDPDGVPPTFSSIGNAIGGTASVVGSNVEFTPDADFYGQASFEYTIIDSAGATDTQMVVVTVAAVNDAPVIGGDVTESISEDGVLTHGGQLTIFDIDTGESAFVAQSNTAGTHGSFDERRATNNNGCG